MIKKILLIIFMIMMPIHLEAYFNDAAEGARPSGMGSAFVSIADDGNAMLYNPAGMTQIKKNEFTGMYSALNSGLDAVTFTGNKGVTGYNFMSITVPFFEERTDVVGFAWTMLNDELYQEHTFAFAYAFNLIKNVGLGMALKHYRWQIQSSLYTGDSDEYPNRSALFPVLSRNAMTMDSGILICTEKGVTLGINIENLLPAEIGLWEEEEKVPMIYRAGISYDIPLEKIDLFKRAAVDSFLLSSEYSYRNMVQDIKFGLETWFFGHRLALRGGVNSNSLSAGFSYLQSWEDIPVNLQLDYALNYAYEFEGSWGSHRLGITVRHDKKNSVSSYKSRTDEVAPEVFSGISESGDMKENIEKMSSVTENSSRQTLIDQTKEEVLMKPVPYEENKVNVGYIKGGLFQFSTAQETLRIMEKFKHSMELRTTFEIVLAGFKDEMQLLQHLENNKLDLIVPCGELNLGAIGQKYVRPVGILIKNKKDHQQLGFYVFEDRENKELSHLNKKKVAVVGMESIDRISNYVKKLEPNIDINYTYYNNAPAALLALYMNQVDAVAGPDNYIETTNKNLVKKQMYDTELNNIHKASLNIKNQKIYMRSTVMPEKKNKILKIHNAFSNIFNNEDNNEIREFFGFEEIMLILP